MAVRNTLPTEVRVPHLAVEVMISRSFRFDSNGNFGQATDFSDIFSKLFGGSTEDPFAGQRGSRVVGCSNSPKT